MIEIKNYNKIAKKPLDGLRGEKTLFQRILGRGSDKPDLMISLKGVARITIPPGESNSYHTHEKEEQVYIVIRGKGVVQVGVETVDAKAGDVVYLPPKVGHSFYNNSKKTAIILNIGAAT
jgi:mannose-6-phosphate isomerase-like protein (cupin superfamily)